MKKAVRIYIFGVVQGVFFRNYIKDSAKKNNVQGYVRNKEDGSVEAWVEGNTNEVNKMIEDCKQGPKHSVIKRLDIVDENFNGFKDFKILKI